MSLNEELAVRVAELVARLDKIENPKLALFETWKLTPQEMAKFEYDRVRNALAPKSTERPDMIPTPRDLLERAESALRSEGWHTTAAQIRTLLGKESV